QAAEKPLPIHSLTWYEKACVELISSRVISSVMCRRRSGCGKIIRCAPSGSWWTKCSSSCRRSLTPCMPGSGVRRFRRNNCCEPQLLQMLYSIRSERLLMEEIDYSMLFRWFIGLNLDDEVWDATVFTKNRDRLLEADVATQFLAHVVEQARAQSLTSDEHFTVDGT